VLAEISGAVAFGAVGLTLARPKLSVVERFPEAERGEEWLLLSSPWRGLITAPGSSIWWGDRQSSWRSEPDRMH
jgi:hypothetical protein